jgi:hypothetical protein
MFRGVFAPREGRGQGRRSVQGLNRIRSEIPGRAGQVGSVEGPWPLLGAVLGWVLRRLVQYAAPAKQNPAPRPSRKES